MNWKVFFDRLGLNGTWWQWRILRWEQKWKNLRSDARSAGRHVTVRHKFCRRCGAIMDHEARECPRCGSRAPSWGSQVVGRAFGLILPGTLPASTLLLAANALVLVIVLFRFGFGQLFQPTSAMLDAMGAYSLPFFLEGEVWRALTYGYLHIGVLHILFNMLALSQAGPVLEEEIGGARLFAVYSAALIGGALGCFFSPRVLVAGASGGIFGLIGFGVAYGSTVGGFAGGQIRAFFLQWALYGFIFTFLVPHVSLAAHAGGFVAGLAAGALIGKERVRGLSRDRFWTALATLCVAATVGAFVWMFLAQ
jgi:rhomboid protease GluP